MTTTDSSLLDALRESRRAVKTAVTGLKDKEGARRSGEGWSVIECLEHLASVEERFATRVAEGAREGAPPRDAAREAQLASTASDRSRKLEAPEAVRPNGRFTGVKAALDAFAVARDRTLDIVRQMGDSLYTVKVDHPVLGPLNGVELARVLDAHTLRHTAQIQDLRSRLGS